MPKKLKNGKLLLPGLRNKENIITDQQWQNLLAVIKGKKISPLPIGFIIDSPWLPGWYGVPIIDYFTNDDVWLAANLKVIKNFPEVTFLPGFWSEYGMCTEPSAFGAKCSFPQNEFPHAHKILHSIDDIDHLTAPNPKTDGLAPFMLNRLKLNQSRIENAGHKIRFSVSRGPLNVAAYLMGSTEFLMALMTEPDKIHRLIHIVTDYLIRWHELQRRTFPTIDGMFVLDDIIGFIGEEQFKIFGLPCFKALFEQDVSVKFLHNDAPCEVSAPWLPEMGVNLFNMGFEPDLNQLKVKTNNKVTLLGNIPPRDVLAQGTPADVKRSVKSLLNSLESTERIILSCGGGMPPLVSSANLNAFVDAVREG